MKDYKEVTAIVLKKSEKVKIEKRKNLRKLSVAIVSFVLIIGIGFAVWFNSFSKEKTIVSYYNDEYLNSFESEYTEPQNGKTVIYDNLVYAITEYKDDAVYHVSATLFIDGSAEMSDANLYIQEAERLKNNGYDVQVIKICTETYTEPPKIYDYIYRLEINALKDQILKFEADKKFGYSLELYANDLNNNEKVEVVTE